VQDAVGVLDSRSLPASASPGAQTLDMRLTNERFATRLELDERPSSAAAWSVAEVIGALLMIFQLDRVTAEVPVQHLYYLPIVLAAVRFGRRAGLVVAMAAVVLYHLAKPIPLAWPSGESDVVQIVLFIAIAIVTARLADDARRFHQLAATDDLTGLHNLRSFEPRLDAMVRACRLARVPMAMLVLDLDRLKSLNDTHGHRAGGEAVRTLGHVLSVRLPGDALACRFGGDEFVVAIPECAAVRAESIADDIRRTIKGLAPDLAGESFPAGTLSVSVGVACLSFAVSEAGSSSGASDPDTGEALFRAADRSLYSAKARGRDRVSVVTLSAVALVGPKGGVRS
jgi:diguanylate cyclase (GGDEF)-like protein